ncbi:MAG: efflux transporter outer membrane subunit [Flavobacteriales bacterium]|nr:efflux transporter outer membrane subunit [Flavobacteriales bacterium]
MKRTIAIALLFSSVFIGCVPQKALIREPTKPIPEFYLGHARDTINSAIGSWKDYFRDPMLLRLIDTALKNNQELNILIQEIEIARNEVMARKGEYLPAAGLYLGSGMDRSARYTRFGALEDELEIKPGTAFPEPLGDLNLGAGATWELDIWRKLRNARKAAFLKYLATAEGRNFTITQLVAEIADNYYELLALDNLNEIIQQNIQIQSNALRIVRQQKESALVSQLAVNRFEAQLLNTQNLQYAIRQRIVETENRIRYLTGRYNGPIDRNSAQFMKMGSDSLYAGIPAQLLAKRPDIRRAELELQAAKLDVEVARANFYPAATLRAGMGFQAFRPNLLLTPESVLYNLAGDLAMPLINRNAIKAMYLNANANQLQAVYNYEQTLLSAYIDVMNQLSSVANYSKSYDTKEKEVQLLNQSIGIAGNLFNSARADYMEVLLTQREALEARMESIEIKLKELRSGVGLYRALGGGWQ